MSDTGEHLYSEFVSSGLRTLIVDRITVEVTRAFEAAGIPSVLMKGPVVAQWLYEPDEVRGYGDSDLLIRRQDWEKAGEVLTSLGFAEEISEMAHPRMESYASDPWYRGPTKEDNVDLHATLYGIGADMDAVWELFSSTAVPIEVAGEQVKALGLPARTAHVALHIAQHQDGKARVDLERALARVDEQGWREAAEVARRLDALPAFSNGLKQLPEGAALAERLGVADARSVPMDLRASGVPLTEGLHELLEARGLRGKARVVLSELAPNPTFMRWWSPLARRGRLGLIAAYIWRPIYMLLHVPAALRELVRALRR
jgi:Uncharacterised nucleotidyltransferase